MEQQEQNNLCYHLVFLHRESAITAGLQKLVINPHHYKTNLYIDNIIFRNMYSLWTLIHSCVIMQLKINQRSKGDSVSIIMKRFETHC